MLKIGVFGVGHLGKIHIKCIQNIANIELVGFYDPNKEVSSKVEKAYSIKRYDRPIDLIREVDIVDIVSPTTTHFEIAQIALKHQKHLFIEKPLTNTIEEANALALLLAEAKTKVQVGHVERFNPAFQAIQHLDLSPMFIEGHRLSTFNPRGTDVSVILDLMIHDIDIVLTVVDSPIQKIHASGVAVVSDQADIANVRIEFENGCVANLTASRISMKKMRKLRLFQKDAYISLDFLEKNTQVVRLYEKSTASITEDLSVFELETNQGTKLIHIEMPEIVPVNAIEMELKSLIASIEKDTDPVVSFFAGQKALIVAHQIMDKIAERK